MFSMSQETQKMFSEEAILLEFEADMVSLKIRTDKNNAYIGGFCEYFMSRYHSFKGDSAAQKYLLDTVLSQFYLEMLEEGLPEYKHEVPDDGAYLDMNVIQYGSKKAAKMKPYHPPRAKKPKKEKEAYPLETTARIFGYLMERILESAHVSEKYNDYMEHIAGKPPKKIYQRTLDAYL